MLAKNLEKPKIKIPIVEKKVISPKPNEKGKSLPKNQRETSCEAFLLSLLHTRTYKAKVLQASGTQEG